MRRNSFTQDEVVLCAYAALYDENEFGGIDTIHRLTDRSRSSISMKIRNIAATLDEESLPRNNQITPLTGTAPGQGSRRTNWDIIKPLTQMPRQSLQDQCGRIVASIPSEADRLDRYSNLNRIKSSNAILKDSQDTQHGSVNNHISEIERKLRRLEEKIRGG